MTTTAAPAARVIRRFAPDRQAPGWVLEESASRRAVYAQTTDGTVFGSATKFTYAEGSTVSGWVAMTSMFDMTDPIATKREAIKALTVMAARYVAAFYNGDHEAELAREQGA